METIISAFGPKHGSLLSIPSRTNMFYEMKLSHFPQTLFRYKPTKQVHLKLKASVTCTDRTFTKLPPSEWTNHFHSVSIDVSEMDELRREMEALKPKVREMLMFSKCNDSMKKRILMIYLLVSLGLAYHFEDEIDEILKVGFKKIDEIMDGEDDLYSVSTIFWVFRTYGYNMSSDVFTSFKEDNGSFKACLIEDVRGMLSLYEAAHLATTTDLILNEALSFASNNLVSISQSDMCPTHLSRHIQNAFVISQRWNMEIIVAVHYIQFYEQEVGHNKMLLKFAKLNFNLLQNIYLQELQILSKWYKDLDFASKFPPFYRESIVEMHFFGLAYFIEPHSSRSRLLLTKLFIAELILDDICDRFATLSEVESIVNSLKRWAPDDAMDTHPEFLKFLLKFVMDVFEDCEKELGPLGGSYSVKRTKEEFIRFAQSNLDLAKLAPAGKAPNFEEYMKVGTDEVGGPVIVASALISMDDINAEEAFDWLKSRPQLIQSMSELLRFLNDVAGFEDDMRRGFVATGMNCYMNQYGVSKAEVFKEFKEMIANTYKVINEEFLKTDLPRRVLKKCHGLAISGRVAYNIGEGVTYPKGRITNYIKSVYINRI